MEWFPRYIGKFLKYKRVYTVCKHLCKKGEMKEWSGVEKNRRWESNTTLSLPFYIILTLDAC